MFVADIMLKKLARWLRILGFDTTYPDVVGDDEIMGIARKEKRALLTQDVELAERAGNHGVRSFLVPREVPVESQVAAVLGEFGLSLEFPEKTLCPQCNGKLEIVGKENVRGNPNVPGGVVERNEKFWLCGGCGKVYWEGSHWKRIRKSVEKIRGELDGRSDAARL